MVKMENYQNKFHVGQDVVVKGCTVGHYYSDRVGRMGKQFTRFMKNHIGKPTVIISIEGDDVYKLSIDGGEDEFSGAMLRKPKVTDDKLVYEEDVSKEVHMVVKTLEEKAHYALIDHAIDTGNQKLFKELTSKKNENSYDKAK